MYSFLPIEKLEGSTYQMKGVSTLIRFNVHILNTSLRRKKAQGVVTYHHDGRLHEKKSVCNQKIFLMDNTHIPLPRPVQDLLWEHCPINGRISGMFWTAFLNPCIRNIFQSVKGQLAIKPQEILLGKIYYYSDTVISLPGPRLSG